MSNDQTFNEAKQVYMEPFGEAPVTRQLRQYRRPLLSAVIAGLVLLDLRTIRTFQTFKPLMIRIDEVGGLRLFLTTRSRKLVRRL